MIQSSDTGKSRSLLEMSLYSSRVNSLLIQSSAAQKGRDLHELVMFVPGCAFQVNLLILVRKRFAD